MKLSIAFPMLALSLAVVGCDESRSDWADADAAQKVEERSVPELVDKARPEAATATESSKAAEASEAAESSEASEAGAEEAHVDATKARAKAEPKDDEPEAEPAIDVDAELSVKRLVIAKGVEGREPVSPASTFSRGEAERIYAFVEVGNEDKSPSAITVSFFRDGKPEGGGVELRVGASPRWRTWAYTRLANEPGAWHVVVRGPKGQELARDRFEIVGGADPQARLDGGDKSAEAG